MSAECGTRNAERLRYVKRGEIHNYLTHTKMRKESIIEKKTFDFALQIIRVYKKLVSEKEFTISQQLLRSGTSIGANVAEGERGQTKADFLAKMNIALKEANETKYWLRLLVATEYIGEEADALVSELEEIISILVAITKCKI